MSGVLRRLIESSLFSLLVIFYPLYEKISKRETKSTDQVLTDQARPHLNCPGLGIVRGQPLGLVLGWNSGLLHGGGGGPALVVCVGGVPWPPPLFPPEPSELLWAQPWFRELFLAEMEPLVEFWGTPPEPLLLLAGREAPLTVPATNAEAVSAG